MERILVVDDEEQVLEGVQRTLERIGFDVVCAGDAGAAMDRLKTYDPDIIVLDIMLPGMSGIEFCKDLRRSTNIPIIFLSGLDSDVDRIVGLELGADDYLTKPFHPGELVARVRAVLRRTSTSRDLPEEDVEDQALRKHGDLRLDLDRHMVFAADVRVELTKTEFLLLKTLMRYPTRVYSRDELMRGAYGPATYVSERTIDSHIRRLREKLREAGIDVIETVRGVGYRIRPLL